MKPFIYYVLAIVFYSSLLTAQNGGKWAWMAGDTIPNTTAINVGYGIWSSLNQPPPLYEPVSWVDKNGVLYMYGGQDFSFSNTVMWKYNPFTNQWQAIKDFGSIKIAGTKGIASANNAPGTRKRCAITWTDTSGVFWLYGGGFHSDLWSFNPTTEMWTWENGTLVQSIANFGTQGVPSPANTPGVRLESNASWCDSSNNLWFFGGANSSNINYNDLWKYSIATQEWTWMSGTSLANDIGNFGVKGIPSVGNIPPARMVHAKSKDQLGNFILFGGNSSFTNGYVYNDVWKYFPSSNEWAWIAGTNVQNDTGNYTAFCALSDSGCPSSRQESRACFTDQCNNMWLFAGAVNNSSSLVNCVRDLWIYHTGKNQWQRLKSSGSLGTLAVYGLKGIGAYKNAPAPRGGSIAFIDTLDRFFATEGYGNINMYNDMWMFVADSDCYKCNAKTNAFASSNTNICAGLCTDFFGISPNAVSYQWAFTGASPGISTLMNPTNICYASAGSFDVQLITTDANGNSDTLYYPSYISVSPTPIVTLGVDTQLCTGDSVLLTMQPGYNNYLWSNGNTNSQIWVTGNGVYWGLSSINNCEASDTIVITAIQCAAPFVNFQSSDSVICEKSLVDFFDLSNGNPTSWQWTFTGGQPVNSTLQNPTGIYYNAYGNYPVKLVATNQYGKDSATINQFINIVANPASPFITYANSQLCSTPAVSYQWFLNNVAIPNATQMCYTPAVVGLYYVLIEDSNGCSSPSNSFVVTESKTNETNIHSFDIRPSPNNGQLEIYLSSSYIGTVNLIIYDNKGDEVLKRNFEKNKQVLSELIVLNKTLGIYMIRMVMKNSIVEKKFLIK